MKFSAPFKNADRFGSFWSFKVTPDVGNPWTVDCQSREACRKQIADMKGEHPSWVAAGWDAIRCVAYQRLTVLTAC